VDPSNENGGQGGSNTSNSSSARFAAGKRSMQNHKSLSEDDGENSDKKKPKPSMTPDQSDFVTSLFACPYYKKDPKAYCRVGSCTGPGFKGVSRVKFVTSILPAFMEIPLTSDLENICIDGTLRYQDVQDGGPRPEIRKSSTTTFNKLINANFGQNPSSTESAHASCYS
jgi:hypothetical protein